MRSFSRYAMDMDMDRYAAKDMTLSAGSMTPNTTGGSPTSVKLPLTALFSPVSSGQLCLRSTAYLSTRTLTTDSFRGFSATQHVWLHKASLKHI